ncbi:MAG: LysM peptidoglycan-binding domain-containing protein [Anaeromicrobium sp.]|jgi:spore germination protein|uniref:LysM peptidoglycan-binding domain-containing protein n=1 Tax=Anaeromicrobium sp. TaxID=1929132 RepID=UPI0025FBB215|nr:LysM peptidoglycan-binding domain-containing protein [Anaeromicrobium sp.]MCT4593995.1 LysM peptidoglycan-binding domain-containing protein [Anaeromicrobium sp.]
MLIHTVKPGESLWEISTNYKVPIKKIIEVNKLPNPNRLVNGQSLVIPTQDRIHIVRPGESLWKIAKDYGTSVKSIVKVNKISDTKSIYPGKRLYILAPRHYVKRGEMPWEIGKRYGVSLESLLRVNNIEDPRGIYPGTILIIPRKEKPPMDVNGYIYKLDKEAIPIVREDGKYLTYLSPFAYLIKEDGSLQVIKDVPAIKTAYEQRVVPIMSITNFTSTEKGENVANIILNSDEIQEKLLTNIINIMKEKRYKGLNVDFENVLPKDREPYNKFMERTVERLHPKGYFVSSALAPKVSADQPGLLYEAHDYEAHGKIADFVILMTYEWGARVGPPQAISPLDQIKRVLDYAVTVIPREKIYFGFQIYARDWLLPHRKGQEAKTFSPQEAILKAVKYGATIKYDEIAQSPYYRYRDEEGRMHEVWFEDARSAQAKFDAVKDYNLSGISYWVLGYPYPQNWVLLEDNFNIRKEL